MRANNGSREFDWTIDVSFYITICQAFNITATSIIVWILVCMAIYGIKAGKWNNTKPGRMFIAGYTALIFALPPFPLAITIPYISYMVGGVITCELMLDIFGVACGIFVFATYLYLWYRQRSIYGNPCMQAIFGKFVNTVSWIAFVFICAEVVGLSVGYTLPESYREKNDTCIFDPSISHDKWASGWQKVRKYVVGGCTILSQIILLSLFIYPMIKNRKSQQTYQTAYSSGQDDMIASVIRRATACTTVSVFSDVLAFALRGLLPWGSPVLFSTTAHNLNFLINAICIMSTFGVNKKILTVFCWSSKKKRSLSDVKYFAGESV